MFHECTAERVDICSQGQSMKTAGRTQVTLLRFVSPLLSSVITVISHHIELGNSNASRQASATPRSNQACATLNSLKQTGSVLHARCNALHLPVPSNVLTATSTLTRPRAWSQAARKSLATCDWCHLSGSGERPNSGARDPTGN